jgi:uncharacterized protein
MNNNYLGVGLSAPVVLVNGSWAVISGADLVNQSIKRILDNIAGYRLLLPEFGSRLEEALFEPNDVVSQSLIRHFIMEALATWEARCVVKDITFHTPPSRDTTYCTITYNLVQSNEENSFIYPFYTNLKY